MTSHNEIQHIQQRADEITDQVRHRFFNILIIFFEFSKTIFQEAVIVKYCMSIQHLLFFFP